MCSTHSWARVSTGGSCVVGAGSSEVRRALPWPPRAPPGRQPGDLCLSGRLGSGKWLWGQSLLPCTLPAHSEVTSMRPACVTRQVGSWPWNRGAPPSGPSRAALTEGPPGPGLWGRSLEVWLSPTHCARTQAPPPQPGRDPACPCHISLRGETEAHTRRPGPDTDGPWERAGRPQRF